MLRRLIDDELATAAKLEPDKVVLEALDLLGEVGLAGISTRRLARRLGVEPPALYWQFRNKAALLEGMATAAMRPHAAQPVSMPPADRRAWFVDNIAASGEPCRHTAMGRSCTPAAIRAGRMPGRSTARSRSFASGLPGEDAAVALLGAGRFALGCVLKEQADRKAGTRAPPRSSRRRVEPFRITRRRPRPAWT